MVKQLKKKYKAILLGILSIFFYFIMFMQFKNSIDSNSNKPIKLFIVISIITLIITVVVLLIINKKKNYKYEHIFLILNVFFGLLYLVFIPALLGTDELPHFLRPYQISVGDIVVKNPEKK